MREKIVQKCKITLSLFNAKSARSCNASLCLSCALAVCKAFVVAESTRRMSNTLTTTTDMRRKLARSQEVK